MTAIFDFDNDDYTKYCPFHDFGTKVKSELIVKYLAKRSGILYDIGCGSADIGMMIHPHFTKIIGFDKSPKSIYDAKSKGIPRAEFRCCDVFDGIGNISDDHFDMIMVNLLHHVEKGERRAMLTKTFDMLKSGSRLLLFELNPLNIVQYIYFKYFSKIDQGMHLVNPLGTYKLLKSIGYRRIRFGLVLKGLMMEYYLLAEK